MDRSHKVSSKRVLSEIAVLEVAFHPRSLQFPILSAGGSKLFRKMQITAVYVLGVQNGKRRVDVSSVNLGGLR